jgi:hypothetical protein
MKNNICILLLFLATDLFSQQYTPTTVWPFLYEDFRSGTVFFSDSGKPKDSKLNIHLLNATLWHQDGENMLQSDPGDIDRVVIANDTFIYINGELARLVATKDKTALVELVKGNYAALISSGTGAYGMSTQSSSVRRETTIGDMNYSLVKIKTEGSNLPLTRKYYFLFADRIVAATRKELEKALPQESIPKLRAFVKTNKIRWNDESSMIRLVDFFR